MQTIIPQIASRHEFKRGRGLLEIGCIWVTYGAIIDLEALLNKEMRVLEFGSGGSTVFFANRTKFVKSFETDNEWYKLVKNRTANFDNVELILTTHDKSIEMTAQEDDESYDVILSDSGVVHGHTDPNRRLEVDASISKLKKGGWLIVDNYEHYGMADFDYEGFEVWTHDAIGHSGRGTIIARKNEKI